ncbi:hypothetical protein NNJEOMEG_02189 [Fundidesulfovibrio magnetotacticus]|uniref:Uncharacterized protein n=1 Tax=Fundidesulfovibrio magnetotacticus TaxID=2730080 RepID=A0A6V8M1L9_9BACT|nr:radical SAM protein [Fundidesulfovibrio magnetotacticus]GFK94345.1 hypothetical protein NNJEOMEG_02189 [Fundidesulfovibrio magnetotacticus]
MRDRLRVALCDLRHTTCGIHSTYVPIGIGYIGAHLIGTFGSDKIDLRLYTDVDTLMNDIQSWRPEVVGVSNYCWNSNLSYSMLAFAKKVNPETLCVMGGPDVPDEPGECLEYMTQRPALDFYVHDHFNGEQSFVDLVQAVYFGPSGLAGVQEAPTLGSMCISPSTRQLLRGERQKINKKLDFIASPYLMGILDKWLSDKYVPSLQTTRGCPYFCAYCHTGSNLKGHAEFSAERIKREIDYIFARTSKINSNRLAIFDSNFGTTKHDYEIAEHLQKYVLETNWPLFIDSETSKVNPDRAFAITKMLGHRFRYGLSRQTMNKTTEAIIKRTNIPLDKCFSIARELKVMGQDPIVCEIIVPMPEETLASYIDGQRQLVDAGINPGATYTTMMLKGTPLASPEFRARYGMKTKYRLLPRQFGEYDGKRVFEIEEVCIATNTLSFEDYKYIRIFTLLVETVCCEQMSFILRHAREAGVGMFDYTLALCDDIVKGLSPMSPIFEAFIDETRSELFDSPQAIQDFFSTDENFNALLAGKLGDNLIRKYLSKIFFQDWNILVDYFYNKLLAMAHDRLSANDRECLDAARRFAQRTMRLNRLFVDASAVNESTSMVLPCDVLAWHTNPSAKLTDYHRPAEYVLGYDKEHCLKLIDELRNIHKTSDPEHLVGNLLWRNWKVREFWAFKQIN